MNSITKLKSMLVLSVLFIFASCGSQKPMVSDLEVSSTTNNGEVNVVMDATLNLGNVLISDITFPILRHAQQIGSISIYTDMSGKSKFEVSVNVSAIANIQALTVTLPNGNPLPLIRHNNTVAIPIEGGKAYVYLTFSDGVAALGASIAIKGLDSVGAGAGIPASIFPMFNLNNVVGSAGLYLSPEAGKNGFALVADISNVINTGDLFGNRALRSAASAKSAFELQPEPVQLNYNSINPPRRTKRKIDKKLYRLHRRRAVL